MRVLLAFDKFKDAMSAHDACEVAARAIRRIHPDWTLDVCPLTDGGDGFETILRTSLSAQPIEIKVTGPRGEFIAAGVSLARFAQFPEAVREQWLGELGLSPHSQIAIVEMARASGLARLAPKRRDPWHTTTHGTGQLIRAAAELGAEAIVVGLGGSATNDVGIGALSALGLEFLGEKGEAFHPPLPHHGYAITQVHGEVYGTIPPLILATDVANPLLGPQGATASYGPQKGLSSASLPKMETWVHHIANLLLHHTGTALDLISLPGTGAAGGIAFGLVCAARGRLVPGYDFTAACLDLPRRIDLADVVVTGEGRFDRSSYAGKGPGRIVTAAKERGKPVRIIAGQIDIPAEGGVELFALSPKGEADVTALQSTASNLAIAAQRAFSR